MSGLFLRLKHVQLFTSTGQQSYRNISAGIGVTRPGLASVSRRHDQFFAVKLGIDTGSFERSGYCRCCGSPGKSDNLNIFPGIGTTESGNTRGYGASIRNPFSERGFQAGSQIYSLHYLRPGGIIRIGGYGYRRQYADDRHDDHQFDEGKALLYYFHVHYSRVDKKSLLNTGNIDDKSRIAICHELVDHYKHGSGQRKQPLQVYAIYACNSLIIKGRLS